MADTVAYQVTNAAAFEGALTADVDVVKDLKGPLGAAARELLSLAQAAAPHLTGRLAGAHRAQPAQASRVRIVADTPYAAVIHWGWPGHDIRRQPWLVAVWQRTPTPLAKMAESIQSALDKNAAKT